MDKTEKSIDKIDEQIDSLLNNKKKRVKSSEKIIVNYVNRRLPEQAGVVFCWDFLCAKKC